MAYRPGDNKVACQRCGFTKYASECRRTWDNWFVCKDCWEPKHPSLSPPKLQADRVMAKEVHLPVEYFIEPEE